MVEKNEFEKELRMWSRKIGGDHSFTITIPSYVAKSMGLAKGGSIIIKYMVHKRKGKIVGGDPYFIVDRNL